MNRRCFIIGAASAVLLALSAFPAEAQEANWHLLTKSYGGTVSLLHGLTKDACEFSRNRMLGLPATDEERTQEEQRLIWQRECVLAKRERCGTERSTTTRPGDIQRAECFQ